MSKALDTLYWKDKTSGLNEYNFDGEGSFKIVENAIIIRDENGLMVQVIAPGDWHNLIIEWKEAT